MTVERISSTKQRAAKNSRVIAEQASRVWRVGIIVLLVMLGAVLPVLTTSTFILGILVLILLYTVLTESLDLILGRINLPSVAHGALFAVGEYTFGIMTAIHKIGFWPSFIAAIPTAALASALLMLVTSRTRGHYFALSSLAFAFVVQVVLTQWNSFTEGALGIVGVVGAPSLSFLGPAGPVSTIRNEYYYALVLLLVVLFVISVITRGRFGRSLKVIRSDELLASALGIDVVRQKVKLFLISGAIAGAAGALYAGYITYIVPTDASYVVGFSALVYAVIGGSGTLVGPIVGSVIVVGLTQLSGTSGAKSNLIFAVALLVVLLFFPGGTVGTVSRAWSWLAKAVRPQCHIGGPEMVHPELPEEHESSSRELLSSILASEGAGAPITEPAAEDAQPVIKVEEISKSFGGVRAVNGVSLNVGRGEIVGVIGPNGAGKSTLFGVIAGTVSSSNGRVLLEGSPLGNMKAHGRARVGIARTFQTNRILMYESVMTNLLAASHLGLMRSSRSLSFSAWGDRKRVAERRHALDQLVAATVLRGKGDRLVGELTVLEQKIVGVLMAVACKPKALLLDEPFAGLRDSESAGLQEMILEFKASGIAVLLVEHRMSVIQSLCDRVYVVDQGAVISEGTPQEVIQDPVVVSAYLGTEYA